jgi:hypothetical protein
MSDREPADNCATFLKRVDSPRVGILYDIYHAQIDDGDVVRTIRNNIQWIKRFHTAGNPGRNELDDNQELNYRFIARTIAEPNYTGYIGHECSPTQGADPTACLKQAFEIFDVRRHVSRHERRKASCNGAICSSRRLPAPDWRSSRAARSEGRMPPATN